MAQKFPGIIKAGKTRYADSTMTQIRQYLATIPDGPVWMQIWRRGRTQSNPMRKYYWATVMQMIADETGHSREALHIHFKLKFLGEPDKHGITEEPKVFSRGSEMDVAEKWDYIMNVRRWAADFLNIWVPEPDPQWRQHRRAA